MSGEAGARPDDRSPGYRKEDEMIFGEHSQGKTPIVHATIRMLFPPKRRGEVLEILGSLAERCRFDPGCAHCRIYQDAEAEPVFMLDQLWKSSEDLERHMRSEEFRKLLLVMEMSLEPPEIRFEEIARSGGMETIEEARKFLPGEDGR
jgi:quinol monooxygenase YgiN